MSERLPRDSWWPAAQKLDLSDGKRYRLEHCCGPGRTIMVSCDPEGISAYCFRCDESDRVRREISVASRIDALSHHVVRNATKVMTGTLPDDFTHELPTAGKVWLWKASLMEHEWAELGVGYSPSLNRIVLPIRDASGNLIAVQARAIDFPRQKPKYLNTGASAMFLRRGPDSSTIILCEDILSAARVGRHVHGAAICGVSMDTNDLAFCTQYRNVGVWLDPDRAGINGAAKALRKLLLINPRTRTISSRADPKNLPDHELLACIKGAFND